MTFEIAFTLAVVAGMVGLFLWERFPSEAVAFLGLGAVVAGGVINPEEALLGFGNPAAITIAGMFVLSAGLERTGAIDALGDRLRRLPLRGEGGILMAALPLVILLSAFLNNTPVVVIFVPLLVGLARRHGTVPSRLLMPLSFAAMLGGTCTLIGTSTNLLVNDLIKQQGLPPLGFFEIGKLGVPLAAAGLAYLWWVAPRILPRREPVLGGKVPRDRQYLSEVVIREGSPLLGQRLSSSAVSSLDGVSVLQVIRNGEMMLDPLATIDLEVGDKLVITAPPERLRDLHELNGIAFDTPGLGVELVAPHEAFVVEGVLAPESGLLGRSLAEVGLRQRYGLTVLAVHRHATDLVGGLLQLRLAFGDVLLMRGTRESVDRIRRSGEFVMLDDLEHRPHRRHRMPLAVAILGAVVLMAGTGLVGITPAVLVGCVALVLGGCLDKRDAYRAVEWEIVLLIVGMLGVARAVEASGAGGWLVQQLLEPLAALGPRVVLSGVYLLTALVTAFLSNNAAAVLLTPIAIAAGVELGIDPRALAIAVAFGASASFATPIGYQTNLFVYGVGGYRFRDFVVVGLPLNLIGWLTLLVWLPRVWPL